MSCNNTMGGLSGAIVPDIRQAALQVPVLRVSGLNTGLSAFEATDRQTAKLRQRSAKTIWRNDHTRIEGGIKENKC